jgi:hypothetical protein
MRSVIAVLALAFGTWALGCESIAGIEDRTFQGGVKGSPACENYCNLAADCTGALAAYPNRDLCILTCAALPPGELDKDNSLECRTKQAENATSEPAFYCPGAGPFGADKCGSTCDAYCSLTASFCPKTLENIDCMQACSGLRHDGVYDYATLGAGDNVECRIAQAVRASADPETYCPGAAPKSTACADPGDGEPDCNDYCTLVTVACTGANTVYESKAQCMAVCPLLEKGKNSDTTPDTVGCRKYHSYNALSGPESHCPHAAPTGDGHCGPSCPAYCMLLEKTCPTEFATTYGDASTCNSECATIPGALDDKYFEQQTVKDTMRCRVTNVARAAEKGANLDQACSAAVGGGECQNI